MFTAASCGLQMLCEALRVDVPPPSPPSPSEVSSPVASPDWSPGTTPPSTPLESKKPRPTRYVSFRARDEIRYFVSLPVLPVLPSLPFSDTSDEVCKDEPLDRPWPSEEEIEETIELERRLAQAQENSLLNRGPFRYNRLGVWR